MKAVIYARYSSDNQREESIEGQIRDCRAYAEYNGIEIVGEYIDRAFSAKTDDRPDFQRMIADSAKKLFDVVLVWKLDRFARNRYDSAFYRYTLRKNGVRLISVKENISDGPEGIILESMIEGMNQYFSAELSQKIKRGMRETRLKGHFQGGYAPYGYKLDGPKIIIDEEAAENVRFIFTEYSKGVRVCDILDELARQGRLCSGKPFSEHTIYNVLRREKYTGVYCYGGDEMTDMYPKIIEPELYKKVHSIIEKNRYGKRSVNVVYLLRGKIFCGYCGQTVIADCSGGSSGKKKYYYKCRGRKDRLNDCKKKTVRKEELEQLVMDAVITRLNDKGFMDKFVQDILSEQEKRSRERSSLQALVREQKQIETALNNIMTAIEKGVVNGTTQKRMKELEARQEELERLILIERSKQSITYTESQIREYYEKTLKEEPQALINLLVKRIVLYDDKVEIYFTAPIAAGPDDDRGFLFCKFSF